jgi:hypothetical protein
MRFLYALAAMLCAAFVYASEPPTLIDSPPVLIIAAPPTLCDCDTCDCPDGACPACTVSIASPLVCNDSHNCPRCGTYANVVERELGNGTHSHRCGSCATEWYHADPGTQFVAAPANPFTLSSPGCADGSCARAPRATYSTGSVSSTRVQTYSSERRGLFPLFNRDRPRLFGAGFRFFGRGCCR